MELKTSDKLNSGFVPENSILSAEEKKDFVTKVSELFTKRPEEAEKYVTTILWLFPY